MHRLQTTSDKLKNLGVKACTKMMAQVNGYIHFTPREAIPLCFVIEAQDSNGTFLKDICNNLAGFVPKFPWE